MILDEQQQSRPPTAEVGTIEPQFKSVTKLAPELPIWVGAGILAAGLALFLSALTVSCSSVQPSWPQPNSTPQVVTTPPKVLVAPLKPGAASSDAVFKAMNPKQHATEARRLLGLPKPTGDDLLWANKHAIESKDKALNDRTASALRKSLLKYAAAKVDNSSLALSYAYVMCKQGVLQRLKAPGTATFGSSYEQSWHWKDHPGWAVANVQVDAQNSFGAQLRNTFECRMFCLTEENCRIAKMYQIENR
jgi:hypothetical protein